MMNRRDFLISTAAIGTGALIPIPIKAKSKPTGGKWECVGEIIPWPMGGRAEKFKNPGLLPCNPSPNCRFADNSVYIRFESITGDNEYFEHLHIKPGDHYSFDPIIFKTYGVTLPPVGSKVRVYMQPYTTSAGYKQYKYVGEVLEWSEGSVFNATYGGIKTCRTCECGKRLMVGMLPGNWDQWKSRILCNVNSICGDMLETPNSQYAQMIGRPEGWTSRVHVGECYLDELNNKVFNPWANQYEATCVRGGECSRRHNCARFRTNQWLHGHVWVLDYLRGPTKIQAGQIAAKTPGMYVRELRLQGIMLPNNVLVPFYEEITWQWEELWEGIRTCTWTDDRYAEMFWPGSQLHRLYTRTWHNLLPKELKDQVPFE